MAGDEVDYSGVLDFLEELIEDNTIPKNVRNKISNIISILKEDSDPHIRKNKALDELEEISNDSNMQSYTRTQIWNVISMLENS